MKVKLSFGHKAVISSLSKLNINPKTSFTKVAQFGMIFEKVKVKLSFGHKSVISSLSKLNKGFAVISYFLNGFYWFQEILMAFKVL